ncbi:MAG: VOC family protein [Pseudomonadales bacterium]|nr:VOC family protein [Pseudomonadales bacterium]
MKRLGYVLICWGLAVSLVLAGCGNRPDGTAQAPDTEPAQVVQASAPNDDELAAAMAEAMSAIEYADERDIGLMARFHFATHTKDFDSARAFYRSLGYTEGTGGFPLTNTHQMARALGMFDICQYELAKGEVIALPGSPGANIDLLQFVTPFNPDPPYELPNHLGMAYAALHTSDLDADVQYLKSLGVDLLSEPWGEVGSRYVFFRDPEGVLYRLFETAAPVADPSRNMHLTGMPYIGINVSDLDRSLEFYRKFGYTSVTPLAQTHGSLEEARAWGLDRPFEIRGADVAIERGDRHLLRLVQWIEPFDPEPAYPPPINRIGINRIALLVPNVDRAVAILESQGVPFLSEPAPCCSGTGDDTTAIVHAIDPDGAFLELVGGIEKRPPLPHPAHCPPLEIKMPPPEG